MGMGRIAGLAKKAVRKVTGGGGAGIGVDAGMLAESGLFDRDFYLSTYPDVAQAALDPIEHYLRFGWSEGRNPGPGFDTAYYLASNPDVVNAGINPLLHFITHGAKEGRSPLPSVARTGNERQAAGVGSVGSPDVAGDDHLDAVERAILASGCFDETFYRTQARGLIGDSESPLQHYISSGALAGMKPNEWFDTSFYLGRNRDVERAGVNPFHHFLEYGWKELRPPSNEVDAVWLVLFNEELGSEQMTVPQFLRERWSGGGFQNRRVGRYSQNDKVNLVNAIPSFIHAGRADHRAMYEVGKVAAAIGALELAREGYVAALRRSPGNYRYLRALSDVNRNLGDWNAHLECLEQILLINPDSAESLRMVGVARYRAGQLLESRAAFERSLGIERQEETAYQLGLVCSAMGDEKEADLAFAVALRLAKASPADKTLGAGILHQARGDHARAVEAFERLLSSEPANPDLHYRLGRCHEYLYQWPQAEVAYRQAARLAPGYGQASWHFRIGFVNERMGRLDPAALSYRAAIRIARDRMPEWEYRLGYVLESAGKLEAACAAYLGEGDVTRPEARPSGFAPHAGGVPSVLSSATAEQELDSYLAQFAEDTSAQVDGPDARQPAAVNVVDELLAVAETQEREGDWIGAARSCEAAAARDDEQSPLPYEKAGRAFLRAGMPIEAAKALRLTQLLRRPYGVGVAAVRDNRASLLAAAYLEYMNDLPVLENTVMYESFSGLSMTCNPLAIFRHLIRHPEFDGFTHVWVINDRSRVPAEFAGRPDVVFVSRDSFAYVKYLATAGYLINNSGFPGYFIRRPGQKYLATWHGTPLKTLGKEQKYKFYDHKRTQRNFLHATHIISPNAHSTRVQLDSYDIRALYSGLFAETGYPRIDLTLNADAETRAKLRERLSLDDSRKVVLYAPTWRGTPDEVWFDFSKLQNDLEELAKLDCQVIFRGHSWLERAINAAHVQCNVVPADIDTNELLSIVDVLVTDYSSVFFDFFATGKPVVYYIYDVEEYTRDRGLYFEMDELPGIKCRSIDELRKGVQLALSVRPNRLAHTGEFNLHDDGHAARRVVDFLFKDDSAAAVPIRVRDKKRVLIYAGTFDRDRQAELATELANALDPTRYDVILTFTPSAVELTHGGTDRFRRLPAKIIGLPRYGNVLMTPEERWLRRIYEDGRLVLGKETAEIIRTTYRREIYRMIAASKVDTVVVFDGKNNFWPRLLLDSCVGETCIRISDSCPWQGAGKGVIELSYEKVAAVGIGILISQLEEDSSEA